MLREVDEAHYLGAVEFPIFGRPKKSGEYAFAGDDTLPAGRRLDWRDPKKIYGRLLVVAITPDSGQRRFWIADGVPYQTRQEALDRMVDGFNTAGAKEIARIREKERRGAEEMGMSIEEYRAIKKAERAFKQAERDRFYGFHSTEVNPYKY